MNLIEIDWTNKWSLMQTATYYQATMLSLNIAPENAHFVALTSNEVVIQFNPNHDFSPITEQQAIDRYWVIKNNAPTKKFFLSHEELNFKNFARWAMIELPLIPKELEEIGRRQHLKIGRRKHLKTSELVKIGRRQHLKMVKLQNSKLISSLKKKFDGLKESPPIKPTTQTNKKKQKSTVTKKDERKKRILEIIKELGHDPTKLPKNNGKPGVKKATLEIALKNSKLFTLKTFNDAWQELRDEGKIKNLE